jgi:hypothetical protein
MTDIKAQIIKLDQFKPAGINPNKGNPHSIPLIQSSISQNGAGRPMLADKDGEMIAGSHALQAFIDAGFDEAIVIHGDGTKPVIYIREDLDIHSPQGQSLQIGDNVIGLKSYFQDDELVAQMLIGLAEEDAKFVQGAGFSDTDVRFLMNSLSPLDNPYDEWAGMPEFEHDGLTACQSIHVHFKTPEDVQEFANLIGQPLTDKTRSIWYPQAEIESYADKRYSDES